MDLSLLKSELEACLAAKRPVLAVVAVIGSTEESAVDPLRDMLDLRTQFRARGLDFAIHADAAWGGYYNTIRIPSSPARLRRRRPRESRSPQTRLWTRSAWRSWRVSNNCSGDSIAADEPLR